MMPKKTTVFMTTDISSAGLLKVFNAFKPQLPNKVAVKIHSGEPGGKHFVTAAMMRPLVDLVQGTIVECNTAYEGRRFKSQDHWQVLHDHGFTAIAPVDILDEEGELTLPIKNGHQIKINYVGNHLSRYASLLVLSHFKGHIMGGFGGALKNIAIGLASSHGKASIHGAGNADDPWSTPAKKFIEAMADAASSIIDYFGQKQVYLNVVNNLSVDCDCMSQPQPPVMADIGVLGASDPLALDQACIDLVYTSADPGKKHLIDRIESRQGLHILTTAATLGLGQREYQLVSLD